MHSLSATPVGGTFDFGFEYPPGYENVFTYEEVITIQDKYLIEQLKLLTDKRASVESRQDAMKWLTEPLVPQRVAGDLPVLSFQRCCYAYGADPTEVQEQMIRIIAPERLAEFGYE
ncbi:MAG: hypothetical protein ACR2PS_11105 [Pseudomonadales bacterium]